MNSLGTLRAVSYSSMEKLNMGPQLALNELFPSTPTPPLTFPETHGEKDGRQNMEEVRIYELYRYSSFARVC